MKICIIKLGALGDVVRTTPILHAIKEKFPESEITWITKPASREILEQNPKIDKIAFSSEIPQEQFDILYSLEIDEKGTSLANQVNAKEKLGYYDFDGFPAPFNPEAEYYLNTVFDDELKRSNTKTYQEMIFKICNLPYKKQEPIIQISEQHKKDIENFLKQNNLENKKILGVNIGSSKTWPSKAWHKENIKEFISKSKEKGYEIILLGGPEEIESIQTLEKELNQQGTRIYAKNTANSVKTFSALINSCDKIVCADTLALHIALALKKPTIGLFFCTSPNEIESYNLLKKITSSKLQEFFPEKMDQYNEELTKSISPEEVINAL